MPVYFYTAINGAGERVSGSETAEDERQLANILHEKGYLLTTVKTDEKKKRLVFALSFLQDFQGVSLTEKLMFARNLQVMVEAGIPLPKSLEVLAEQAGNKRFKTVLLEVQEMVVKGKTFSEALEEYPKIFSDLFVNMVRVGEESGTLGKVIEQVMVQLDREHDVKSKVLGAMLYPAVIITAMMGIGTLMLLVVVPQLAQVFDELGVELPLTTRVVIGFGTLMAEQWYILFPAIFLSVGILFRLWKTKAGKRIVDTIVLKMPIFSTIVRKSNAALMTRTLSSLISSGVPIVRSLEITAHVVGNVHFQDSLTACSKEVGKGAKLSEALGKYKDIYPIMVIQMIAVGEETGETGKILAKLAEFFEGEVADVTKNLTSILEPVLMLIIGAVVGFFAISMIQPMYSMLGSIL